VILPVARILTSAMDENCEQLDRFVGLQ